MKNEVFSQFLARQGDYFRRKESHLDQATVNAKVIPEFNRRWEDQQLRLRLVPGKDVLVRLNRLLQERCDISLTDLQIAQNVKEAEMPSDLQSLLRELETFRRMDPE